MNKHSCSKIRSASSRHVVSSQAILFETGVLKRLQPQAADMLRTLAATFQERTAAADFTVRQCINILSSMTLLNQVNVPLHDAIVRRCTPELPQCDPADVGSLCYILGIAGYSNRAFLTTLENLLVQRSGSFDVRSLAKCVWMLGRVQYNNENVAGLVDEVVRRSLEDGASPTVRQKPTISDMSK